MKSSRTPLRVVLVVLVISLCAGAAYADSIIKDPKIIIDDPACPTSGCIQVGTNFTFSTPGSGFGILVFTNASGVNWFNLKLTESGVPADAITCVTNAFAKCSLSTSNGIATILLSGFSGGAQGIASGQNFSIEFGCTSGKCETWPGDLDFTATANVPEPATIAFLLTGLGAIVARRKMKARS